MRPPRRESLSLKVSQWTPSKLMSREEAEPACPPPRAAWRRSSDGSPRAWNAFGRVVRALPPTFVTPLFYRLRAFGVHTCRAAVVRLQCGVQQGPRSS